MGERKPILHYVFAYVLWAISTGFGILVLSLARDTVLLAIVVDTARGKLTSSEQFYASLRAMAADTWTYLVLGLLVLILLVGLEHFYRNGVSSGELWKRFFLISAIECGVLVLTHSIYFALEWSFNPLAWWILAIPVVEVLFMALFIWLRISNLKTLRLSRM